MRELILKMKMLLRSVRNSRTNKIGRIITRLGIEKSTETIKTLVVANADTEEKKLVSHAERVEKIDFAWLIILGKRMGFAEKEIGHMSLRKFMKLYEAYKLVFDTENMLSRNGQKIFRTWKRNIY